MTLPLHYLGFWTSKKFIRVTIVWNDMVPHDHRASLSKIPVPSGDQSEGKRDAPVYARNTFLVPAGGVRQ